METWRNFWPRRSGHEKQRYFFNLLCIIGFQFAIENCKTCICFCNCFNCIIANLFWCFVLHSSSKKILNVSFYIIFSLKRSFWYVKKNATRMWYPSRALLPGSFVNWLSNGCNLQIIIIIELFGPILTTQHIIWTLYFADFLDVHMCHLLTSFTLLHFSNAGFCSSLQLHRQCFWSHCVGSSSETKEDGPN